MQRSHSARVDKFNYYLNIKEVIRRTPTPTVSACAKHGFKEGDTSNESSRNQKRN